MTLTDVIILICVFIILSLIIFFNFILPRMKKETPCCKCSYAKTCDAAKNNKKCSKNK